MIAYNALPLNVSGKEAYIDASKEELRVLLALIEKNGQQIEENELSAATGISKARLMSAIVYWKEAGVIREISEEDTVTQVFEQQLRRNDLIDEGAVHIAKAIRQDNLYPLLAECERLAERTLNSREIKDIVSLTTQYGLDDEYIGILAAHLSQTKKLYPRTLVNKAMELANRDITTPASLVSYIEDLKSENETVFAFKSIFGINDRRVSPSELKYFEKWSREYGYFTNIVGEAYDIAVMSRRTSSPQYIDKILGDWHSHGCKTLEECRARYDESKEERKRAVKDKDKNQKAQKPKERYGNFDIDDAFERALERSYGKK